MSGAMQPEPLQLVFCCFTCRRDESLLPLHYAAIQLASPGAPVVYAVDEADKDMELPTGSTRMVTSWDRKGNLIGQAALIGILESLKHLAMEHNALPVKIDSDIMLAGVEWLGAIRQQQLGMVGICPGQLFCASGGGYAISLPTIEACLRYIRAGLYYDLPGIRVEDETISMLAAMVNPVGRVLFYQHLMPNHILSSIFKDEHFTDPSPLSLVEAWVDCGDKKMLNLKIGENRPKEAIKREAMELTLEVLKNKRKVEA